VADWLWIGEEDVQCEIEIEEIGERSKPRLYKATIRRIQRDGLVPLAFGDGRPVEYVETDAADALARAKLFLDRRFGFGAVEEVEGTTSGMRMFALQEAPESLVIAGYGRYGCPVCRIGEPDEDKLEHWIAHAQREHGYDVIADYREPAPGIPYIGRQFRVIRFRRKPLIRQTVATMETPNSQQSSAPTPQSQENPGPTPNAEQNSGPPTPNSQQDPAPTLNTQQRAAPSPSSHQDS
jgi:hypothetical protein